MNKIIKRSKHFITLLLLSVMILSMSIPAVYAQSNPVSDIGSHWAKQEISAWVVQGFIEGYPDGTFKPNNSISRAEFIKLVNRLFAFSEKAPVPFTDVKESDWFYAEFAKASKVGYLSGYKAGTINPNGLITRQEVATIAAKVKLLQEDAAAANDFADAALIPAESKGFIGAVAKAKVMNGYPNKNFEPLKNITRAESVVTLNKLMSLIVNVKIEAIKDKSIAVGDITTVAVKMLPADAAVSIKNSDESIVRATLTGSNLQLKGLKIGTTTITLTGKKNGMLDGVITFKVEVVKATYRGGSSGGGSNPQPVDNELKLTELKAVAGAATAVTGKYGSSVTKVEVTYGNTTVPAPLSNGTFSCSITPGLAIGAQITAKAYDGSTLLDTDTTTVVEDETMLTEVKVIGTEVMSVTGKYSSTVDKVEVCYDGTTNTATLQSGTLTWNILDPLAGGTVVTVKGYVGSALVDIDTVTVGTAEEKPYLSDVKVIGTEIMAVTGKYNSTVKRVEVCYDGTTNTATLLSGTFTWNIMDPLAGGTVVTVKAYNIAGVELDSKTITIGGTQEPYLSDVKVIGTEIMAVTGKYNSAVKRVDVCYDGTTNTATLLSGTFTWNIMDPLASGTVITVKAYDTAGIELDTKTITIGEIPSEEPVISGVTALYINSVMTSVAGNCDTDVDKIEVIYVDKTGATITMGEDDVTLTNGKFSCVLSPSPAKGTQVIVKAYVGGVLKTTLDNVYVSE